MSVVWGFDFILGKMVTFAEELLAGAELLEGIKLLTEEDSGIFVQDTRRDIESRTLANKTYVFFIAAPLREVVPVMKNEKIFCV